MSHDDQRENRSTFRGRDHFLFLIVTLHLGIQQARHVLDGLAQGVRSLADRGGAGFPPAAEPVRDPSASGALFKRVCYNRGTLRTHQEIDARSLWLHGIIAQRMRNDPTLFDRARQTLGRLLATRPVNEQPLLRQWQEIMCRGPFHPNTSQGKSTRGDHRDLGRWIRPAAPDGAGALAASAGPVSQPALRG